MTPRNVPMTNRQPPSRPATPESQHITPQTAATPLPASYQMAPPLNETELMALLMASPMYHKLEAMKKTVEDGGLKAPKHKVEPGQ